MRRPKNLVPGPSPSSTTISLRAALAHLTGRHLRPHPWEASGKAEGSDPTQLNAEQKAIRQQNGTQPLTFASDRDLMDLLGLIPGAVTPLGLLNDQDHKVAFWLDKSFLESSGLIGVHPNENTATVRLKTDDLLQLLRESSTQVTLFAV